VVHRYPALLAIMLPSFVYGFFRFSIGFLLPRLESIYSINDALAGAVVSVSVGLVGIGVFLSAYSSRRYGDRLTIIVGFLVFTIAIGMIAIPASFYGFSLLFLLASFGSGLTIPASYSLIGQIIPQRKGIIVGIVTSGYNLGGLLGPPAVTFILVNYGWTGSFIAFSSVGLVGLLFFFVILGRKNDSHGATGKVSTLSLLRNKLILTLVIANFISDLAFLAYVSWTPSYVTNRFNMRGSSSELIGTFFGAGVGLGGLGAIFAGTMFDKIGGRKSAFLGGIASALSALGIYLTNSLLVSVAFIVVTGFLSNTFWTLLTAMAQASTIREDRAGAISLVQTAGFAGAFVGPALTGLIGGATSSALITVVVLPFIVYAALLAGAYRDPKEAIDRPALQSNVPDRIPRSSGNETT